MAYLLLRLDQLEPDPVNLRQRYTNLDELAESISIHGLLQNLIVERLALDDKYIIRAGNRRFLAIKKLESEGRWNGPVPCLETENILVQIVENIQREDVNPVALGYRYIEIVENGVSAKDLAQALSKTPGHISFHINIARALHPDAQKAIEQIGYKLFTKKHYSDLTRFVEPVSLEPMRDVQLEYIDRAMKFGAYRKGALPIGKKINPKEKLMYRLGRLRKGEIDMDPNMEPFVRAVLDYLDGHTVGIRPVMARKVQ